MNNQGGLIAIIFDMDGVLVDSAPCHRAAFEEIFLPFGVVDFDYGQYAGWRTADVVRHVLADRLELRDEVINELSRRKSRLARERMIAENPTVPGCRAVLEELGRQYVLALASSGSRESVDLFLTGNRCHDLFRSVLCGDEVRRAKPDPEIYQRTFAALDIVPSRGIVVEDAVSGIQAARAAAAGDIIGVAGTVAPEVLLAAGASRVVNAITELPHLLCGHYESARSN
jgi:HAD superfamily hydrolase (TIGR01509 family)